MKFIKILDIIMLPVFIFFGILLSKELSFRINLPYNEMGRYFDENMDVVYHYQGVFIYRLLFILCVLAVILLVSIIFSKKIKSIWKR